MRLKIEPPRMWAQQNYPNGPATFCRAGGVGAFQVSWAEYTGGKSLNATMESCKQLATKNGQMNGWMELEEPTGGSCKFGSYGTGVFHAEGFPRIQMWFITNGRDHSMATHICNQEPSEVEIAEAHQVATSLALGTD